ncbi:MAG: hypothetical protein QUV02_08480 [Maricaulis sp.]|uniref:hypothetical protein n=1 Tax=Maricaulis sp. TaxID=1486257 RepID=UPI0026029559|nr:hypothetical protein [Maricaulis sp.]MDM7984475.1 hypothetical protein [Maricaulis sp.]
MKRIVVSVGWVLIGALVLGYVVVSFRGNDLETCGDPLTATVVEVNVTLDVNSQNARALSHANVELSSGDRRALQPTGVNLGVGDEIAVQRMCEAGTARVRAYRFDRILP